MGFKENSGDSKNRYRLSNKMCKLLGITPNKSKRYRLSDEVVNKLKSIVNKPKILIYDIETSRMTVKCWWTGKQFVGHDQIVEEPKIITIAWKWLGDEDVKCLTWDTHTHSDKELVRKFLEEYNKADLVVGQNNDRFDNRWLVGRAIKYDFDVNAFVKSFDIMKQMKRIARIPSYSMKFITKFKGLIDKQGHEGIIMWEKVESGTPQEQREYLDKMCDYNIGDILSTEDMYIQLRKYMGHTIHVGTLGGDDKFTCPNCGGSNVELYKRTTTPAGTVQWVMKCNDDGCMYKVSTRVYMDYLNNKE